MRRALKPLLLVLCLVPLGLIAADLAMGRIRGDWVKEITHRTGWWGLFFITATLAITPLRRLTGWNRLVNYRRMIGLFAFTYITIHFLIYVVLDRQIPFDPTAWREVTKDIAKRPYITLGLSGFLMMIPLAFTSTKNSIRRLGRRWTTLHSLIYLVALAGVIHFMWSVKADVTVPDRFAFVLLALLGARLVPRRRLPGRRAAAPEAADRPEPHAPLPSPEASSAS